MKIKSLLVGMLACTAMVSCTNDEVLENNEVVKGGEKSYVSVNLVAPGSVSGRAASDFVAGSADEVNVNDAVFLFLDENFAGCAEPYYTNALSFGEADGEGQDKKATVLVIDGAKEVPAYLVAILNPVYGAQHGYTASTTLAQLKAEHATYTNYTAENFVMSNAVYKAENGKEAAATPVTMDYIFDTADKANAKPLTIQVERVVGKVAVTELAGAAEKWQGDEQIDDAEEKELKLVVTGWEVLQNIESTLVKNVDLAWAHAWWNDATLKRSYWATDYTEAGRNELLVDEMTVPATGYAYVEETVSQNANTAEAANVNPYLVVAAKFVDAETEEEVELVEWRGRKYTKEGYLNFIAGNSKVSQYWTKNADGTYTSFSAELLEMVDDEATDWKAIAALKDEATEFYTCTFNADGTVAKATAAAIADVEAAIAEFGDVQYWNGGRTYYYTPIKHQTVGTDNFYGVVRNHVYNVKITGITGYGTPVSDPTQAIEIPEKPVDDNSYLAAEVVILDWKVVNNEVELN